MAPRLLALCLVLAGCTTEGRGEATTTGTAEPIPWWVIGLVAAAGVLLWRWRRRR